MLYARFNHPDWGYPDQGKRACDAGLVVGERYAVEHVSMGQSYTSVYLYEYGVHNSILFDFENDDGSGCDIYSNPKFNHYIKRLNGV